MGNLSDAMQKLVDDIESSAESRYVAVKDLKDETRCFIADTHNRNVEQAEAIRKQLAQSRQNLSSDEEARGESAQQHINNLRVKVSEMNSDTHNLLERFHLEHQDMAKALRQKLSSDEKALRESTQQFMNNVRSEHQDMAKALKEKLSSDEKACREATQQFMNNVRSEINNIKSEVEANREATRRLIDEFASDHYRAHEIWIEGVKKKIMPPPEEVTPPPVAEKPVVEEVVPPVEEVVPLPTAISEDRVLDVIAKHPDGIRLVDIGNEVGVDWRSLIGIVKSLTDEGKIEKIDSIYYPKTRDWESREED